MSRTGWWPARIAAAVLAAVALAACGTTAGPLGPTPPAVTAIASPAASPSPSAPASPSPSVPASPSASAPALHQAHDPGQVTGTLTGPCHTRDGGQLPDPRCTPGAIDPAVTAALLCSPSYRTSTYRPPSSQTSAFKYDVAEPAYGQASVSGELDHLVSLELGGANDASNLWVEAGAIPNPKDSVENALHDWVCAASGHAAETRLHRAQVAIAADWITAEHVLGAG